MRWIKENWVLAVFVAAVILSFVFNQEHANKQDRTQRSQLVGRCIASAQRVALDVAFQYEAGDARKAAGDKAVAQRYYALADAQIKTIAAPKGLLQPRDLVTIVYKEQPDHTVKAVLASSALKLQRQGCVQAFA